MLHRGRRRAVAAVAATVALATTAVGLTLTGTAPWTDGGSTTLRANVLPQPLIPSAGTYRQVFRDDFTGTRLDPHVWTPGWFPTPGQRITADPQNDVVRNCMDAGNVSVGSGVLTLRSRRVGIPVTCSGRTKHVTGGLISSWGKEQDFRYGVYEARMRLPVDPATGKFRGWPAFWLNGQHWPQDREIDVMEALDGHLAAHLHFGDDGRHRERGFVAEHWRRPTDCGDAASCGEWHTFTAERRRAGVTFYYDGVQVGIIPIDSPAPMYLVLSYADQRGSASAVQVDYVAAYVDE